MLGIPYLVDVWLALTGLALPLAVLAADHVTRPAIRLATTLLLPASFALILAATLSPTGHHPGPVGSCGADLATNPVQAVLNVLLFVPAAAVLTLVTARAATCLLAVVGLSVTIEAVQALLPGLGRSCQLHDVIANAAGAVAGAGLISVFARLSTTHRHAGWLVDVPSAGKPVGEVVR